MANKNIGHGHVFPRPDGVVARCGGPAICSECAHDAATKRIESPAEVYLREADAGTPNACWIICAKGDPGSIRFVAQEK